MEIQKTTHQQSHVVCGRCKHVEKCEAKIETHKVAGQQNWSREFTTKVERSISAREIIDGIIIIIDGIIIIINGIITIINGIIISLMNEVDEAMTTTQVERSLNNTSVTTQSRSNEGYKLSVEGVLWFLVKEIFVLIPLWIWILLLVIILIRFLLGPLSKWSTCFWYMLLIHSLDTYFFFSSSLLDSIHPQIPVLWMLSMSNETTQWNVGFRDTKRSCGKNVSNQAWYLEEWGWNRNNLRSNTWGKRPYT